MKKPPFCRNHPKLLPLYESIKTLLKETPPDKCTICSTQILSCTRNSRGSLSDEDTVVGIILQSLLVNSTKTAESLISLRKSQNIILLCKACKISVTKLRDCFVQIEELRSQYNNLRKTIGRQVILSSLNRPEEEWKLWSQDVQNVEHIYPSCYFQDKEIKATEEEEDDAAFTEGDNTDNNNNNNEEMSVGDFVKMEMMDLEDEQIPNVSKINSHND